ncbi:flagellar hook capping FlgD N-terminal domain-containing protein [Antarctobacter heliothermus]|uniref:Basal-body rod modification protein FlgD n=1 Tax=Antarctobacter heliothermus TaxID=74033 RepID=A0A239BUR1_9RHOB|nr:flagellar hook capping FlgD N-terminal domain-containing protein [Antarctobacter heliothermus]SNS11409.1 flagellar basal-body rod modification protein FlgD [Antarctobacter heliothermus]
MTEVTSTPPLYSSKTTTAASDPVVTETKQAVSSDFDTFLKMLTVQLQNQDPLNPVDSTDYATQLATFSSVEQQVLTNDLLREVSATLSGNALQELSGWIGMEGLVRGPTLFSGTPITVRPDYAEEADDAALVVRDSSGNVVQRFSLSPGQEEVLWAGTDETGATLPIGIYRFEVESYKDEAVIDTKIAQVYSQIQEVRKKDDLLQLRMSGGSELDPGQIEGLRVPQS